MIETIEEPVDRLARFEHGRLHPFRFPCNQRVFRIARITGSWEDRERRQRGCYFSVLTDGPDSFERRFHTGDFSWTLSKAVLET